MLTSIAFFLAGGALQADPQAVSSRADLLLKNANTVSGRLVIVRGASLGVARFYLEKPNLIAVIGDNQRDVFNGADRTIINVPAKEFEVRSRQNYGVPYLVGFESFLDTPPGQDKVVSAPAYGEATVAMVRGQAVVRRHAEKDGDSIDVDLDPNTALPVRWTWVRAGETIVADVKDVVVGQPTPAGTFTVDTSGMTKKENVDESALLAAGAAGPEISAEAVNGSAMSLAQTVSKRRATLLLFLDPTQSASADALANAVRFGQKNNVGVVAVVKEASDRTVRQFLSNCRANNVPIFRGTAAAHARSAYHAALTPVVYLLDPSSQVLGSWFGYDQTKVREALAPKQN